MSRISLGAAVSIGMCLAVTPLGALDLRRVLTGYSLSSWAEHDGVPIGPVKALAQDDDGYLWVGTDSGLFRFDGARYVTADGAGLTALPESRISALLIARDGALWIGFADGHGVRVVRNRRVDAAAGHTFRGSVQDFAEDVTGGIWAASDRGLFHFDGRRWDSISISSDNPDTRIYTVDVERDGVVRVGTGDGPFARGADGRFTKIGRVTAAVQGITQDATGQVWVTDAVAGLRRLEDQRSPGLGVEGEGVEVFHDSRENLWVTTRGQGLWRVHRSNAALAIEIAKVETGC